MSRRYDPERRQRIIDAAIRVVGEKGIAGLSHRSVAAEADVPLGSTTYHFRTLDELLVAALRQANEGFAKVVAARGGLRDEGAIWRASSPGCWGSGSRGTGRGSSWSASCIWRRFGGRRCGLLPRNGRRGSRSCCARGRMR